MSRVTPGNIRELMESGLGDWLAAQSTMRAQARERAVSRWVWGAVLLMPVLAFVWFGPYLDGGLRAVGTFLAISGVITWGYQPIAAARQAIKVGINDAIARSFGISYSLQVEPGAEFAAAKTYGLVPGHDRASFEDRWHGMLEGHAFNLYEAHLQERRGSGKNRRWVTVFRGVIITMTFGRPFRSTTLLQRADRHRKWLGLGSAKDSITLDGHRLDLVDQVHPAFAERFSLWSDDQVEARVLVHPTYVEHLLGLERAFAGKELCALFAAGEVVIVVESANLFESGAIDESTDYQRVKECAEQFGALAGLALAINQNERGRTLRDPSRALAGEEMLPPLPSFPPEHGFGRRTR